MQTYQSEILAKSPSFSRAQTIVPSIVHEVLHTPSQSLDENTRTTMETGFGHNFGDVRVHTDERAAQSARSMNALAYTIGRDIVFDAGQYAPSTNAGRRLLTHELTHVAQMRSGPRQPNDIAQADAPAEREAQYVAHALNQGQRVANPLSQNASPSLVYRQTNNAPSPQNQPPPTVNLRTRVREWLDQQHFSLPLVADSDSTPTGQRRVYYSEQMSTLDAVTDDLTMVLGQTSPNVNRPDVWSEVWQYYNQKKTEAEQDRWQTVFQILYTPQYTFASNQPPGSSPWQQSLQLSGGRNYRLHSAGASGLELNFQGNLSLFNLGSGHGQTGDDAFQNLLVSAQAQYVWNLGREFRIAPGQWALVQASLFAQVAAGLGTSYADVGTDRKVFVGFLAQPSAGGQINLNIGWFQIIAQGSVVYSYLSPTTQSGSTSQHTGAFQFGLGVGAQF